MPKAQASPQHIALIMDGNGRWAKQRLLPRTAGHKAAISRVREIIECCVNKRIEALTLFTFSSENWKRPTDEVGVLMELLLTCLHKEAQKLHESNVQVKIIGAIEPFSLALKQAIQEIESLTHNNSGLKLRIALNYGGRWDILQASQKLAEKVACGDVKIEDINESLFQSMLSTSDLPSVDLLIRTSGELRISNFLLWQIAYAELYFTETLFPAFDKHAFEQALLWYAGRERRYGKISEQLGGTDAH